jgi:hypothetical protein
MPPPFILQHESAVSGSLLNPAQPTGAKQALIEGIQNDQTD